MGVRNDLSGCPSPDSSEQLSPAEGAGKWQPYDPDAFDSMAVVNSECWNEGGHGSENTLSRGDLLPQVS